MKEETHGFYQFFMTLGGTKFRDTPGCGHLCFAYLLTKKICVQVASKGGRRKWFWSTDRFRLRDEVGIHEYTCAAELTNSGQRHARGSDVPAGWQASAPMQPASRDRTTGFRKMGISWKNEREVSGLGANRVSHVCHTLICPGSRSQK